MNNHPFRLNKANLGSSGNDSRLPDDSQRQHPLSNQTLARPIEYYTNISFDPTTAKYFSQVKEALNLNSKELSLLHKNGFTVTDRLAWNRFLEAYAWIYAMDLPVLITTDSILNSLSQSHDNLVQDIESYFLIPKLTRLLKLTRQRLGQEQAANTIKELDPLYRDVDTYLLVASSLLSGKAPNNMAARELYSLAVNGNMEEKIILFGNSRIIDFTLFKPRGHYGESKELQRYFRAINWLAQIDFRLVEFDPLNKQPILHRNQVAAAALLRQVIEASGGKKDWEAINQLLEALVGGSDIINLPNFGRLLADMHLTDPLKILVADEKQMLSIILKIDYGRQRISGQITNRDPDNFAPEPVSPPISFVLLGQSFAIDSYVLGELVYDRMIKNGRPIARALPSTLDVMYALGNDHALSHLITEIQKYGYDQQLALIRTQVDYLPVNFWKSSIYNLWLEMIRQLNKPTNGTEYPQSLRTKAWADKMLHTQLASWTQLRHNNILYVKQSYTVDIICDYPKGYVEPYPEFYSALETYARVAYDVLSKVTIDQGAELKTKSIDHLQLKLNGKSIDMNELIAYSMERKKSGMLTYFKHVMAVAKQLKTLAEKEMAFQSFTSEEEKFVKSVVVRRENEEQGCVPKYVWDGWYVKMFYGWDGDPAIIADIHTNLNQEGPLAPASVLHAATGRVVPLCLAAETDEGATMYVGPSFTYYDVTETGFPPARLTDKKWRNRLNGDKLTQHPDWTSSFLIASGGKPQIIVIDEE
jgi:hypothetical protein